MSDKTLIVTVGLPRSGKSTWARVESKAHNIPMVNPDSIRLALHGQAFVGLAEPFVWAIAETMVRSLFLSGHDRVILDATNTTKDRRKQWVKPREWRTVFHVFYTEPSVCIERAKNDDMERLVPVIECMAAQFEPVSDDEVPNAA